MTAFTRIYETEDGKAAQLLLDGSVYPVEMIPELEKLKVGIYNDKLEFVAPDGTSVEELEDEEGELSDSDLKEIEDLF